MFWYIHIIDVYIIILVLSYTWHTYVRTCRKCIMLEQEPRDGQVETKQVMDNNSKTKQQQQ